MRGTLLKVDYSLFAVDVTDPTSSHALEVYGPNSEAHPEIGPVEARPWREGSN